MLTPRQTLQRTLGQLLGRTSRSVFLALLVIGAMVSLNACGSGPTEPDNVLFVNGTVEHRSTSTENFAMTVDGLLQVTLDSIVPQLPEGGVLADTSLVIGFSLGRIIEGECVVSGALAMRPGDSASYGLDHGDYCFRFYDSGFIPEDASYDYSLTAAMTDF
ncbi:MAG: hypothetical protein K8J08_03655 [Thermoanaerobaculia bacterium]|nr:hypothetical protein [Thermoanaerobaculia bacterium]